ncbi:unnamed protein product [Protopolystoma xenopodis]|uniref:Uncharacterized protein n=1 Tax=Protopolystoma xenopodis TaxID=117903 RepID=A0A448WC07_9PLAT|nr:unnamed protein product [Protopolystoma xenopodis]
MMVFCNLQTRSFSKLCDTPNLGLQTHLANSYADLWPQDHNTCDNTDFDAVDKATHINPPWKSSLISTKIKLFDGIPQDLSFTKSTKPRIQLCQGKGSPNIMPLDPPAAKFFSPLNGSGNSLEPTQTKVSEKLGRPLLTGRSGITSCSLIQLFPGNIKETEVDEFGYDSKAKCLDSLDVVGFVQPRRSIRFAQQRKQLEQMNLALVGSSQRAMSETRLPSGQDFAAQSKHLDDSYRWRRINGKVTEMVRAYEALFGKTQMSDLSATRPHNANYSAACYDYSDLCSETFLIVGNNDISKDSLASAIRQPNRAVNDSIVENENKSTASSNGGAVLMAHEYWATTDGITNDAEPMTDRGIRKDLDLDELPEKRKEERTTRSKLQNCRFSEAVYLKIFVENETVHCIQVFFSIKETLWASHNELN